MARSPIASRYEGAVTPTCGTQARVVGQRAVKAAGVSEPGEVKVELAGVVKSTWKRYSGQVELSPIAMKGAGEPAGGRVDPSRSAGSIPSLPLLKTAGSRVVTNVAVVPASIAARSKANGCGPR